MALSLGTLAAAGCHAAFTPPAMAAALAPKHVSATLISESSAAVPGSTVTIGIDLVIEKQWHVYWNGRNDNGFPPKAEWELPTGFSVDAFQWPAPVRHVDPGDLLNHVYFDHVTILVPLRVPATAQPGTTAAIKAKVSWLVCDESCVPEDALVECRIPIAKPSDAAPGKSADAKKFDDARAHLPRELPPAAKDVAISWSPKAVTLSVPGATHLEFFPDEDCVPFASPIKDPVADAAKLSITLGDPEPDHTALTGVLEIRREKDKPVTWYHVMSKPPKAAGAASEPSTPETSKSAPKSP
jgi:DsbC/DsbD-like thiol-disulfide interchange protein